VEVVWKRDYEEGKEQYSHKNLVLDYFDHDFFLGNSKSKI
jgi:hypothetical protein